MPADFIVKAGDTEPVLAQQITDSTGAPVNLTGAAVALQVRSLTQPQPLTLTGTVQAYDAANGKVEWKPSAQDTSVPGQYMAQWVVTYAGGAIQSYPTDGYIWISIEENLSSVVGSSLVSLPDVKEYLRILPTDRQHDAKLLGWMTDVTPLIENVAGPIVLRTIDEWHDGGQFWIQLRRRPSTALGTAPVLTLMACEEYRGPVKYTLSIVSDPAQATIYSVMLDPRSGTIYRRTTGGGVIPFGAGPWGGGMPQAVHVIYQAGQATIPGNVRRAALEAIRWNYLATQPQGTGSRSIADGEDLAGPLGAHGLPHSAMQWLTPNRRRAAIA